MFGGGVLLSAVMTLLIPVCARRSVYALISLRVLAGITEGVTAPSMHAVLSCWIPPTERSRAVSFIFSGAQLGTVIGMLLSGVLCDYGFAGGWPSVFYVYGTAGCVWCSVWYVVCYSRPSAHPRISTAELQYIEKSMECSETSAKLTATPWTKIATSLPFWACASAHFASNWGLYTFMTCLPMYMHDVLQFDITENGILSALPYTATWLSISGGGYVADWLIASNRLQTTTVRKLFCAVGLLIPGLFLITIGLLGCNRIFIVSVIVIAVSSEGLSVSGYGVNHLDLAPKYAGTLMGIGNTLATVPGILGPHVVGWLTYHESDRGQWQKVFYITSAIYCFGAAVFVVFGSGELQDWATVQQITGDKGHHKENNSVHRP